MIKVCSLIILAPAGRVLGAKPSNSLLFKACCGLSSRDVLGVVEQAVHITTNDNPKVSEEVRKEGFMR
jgi:hypothetical protein